MDKNELNATAKLLQRQWGLPEQAISDPTTIGWERLRTLLQERLSDLLDHDFSALVNIMYRLDIPEAKFKAALEAGNTVEISSRLADIVLERELKRLETRRKYNKPDQQNS